MTPRPAIAILSPNVLMGLGLKGVLGQVLPVAEVECFNSFEEFAAAGPDRFYHYFVAAQTYLAHMAFFRERNRKCIVLTRGEGRTALAGVHTVDIYTDPERVVADLMALHHGAHRPAPHPADDVAAIQLTEREQEVLRLIARGERNKQIATELNIGLSTVITHRRNIMEKFGARSAADLILTAITAGYLDEE